MAQNGITYVLNASNTCPKPDFISESHFMRIPVNDNYCEKLLPWLDKTNEFIGKRRENQKFEVCVQGSEFVSSYVLKNAIIFNMIYLHIVTLDKSSRAV